MGGTTVCRPWRLELGCQVVHDAQARLQALLSELPRMHAAAKAKASRLRHLPAFASAAEESYAQSANRRRDRVVWKTRHWGVRPAFYLVEAETTGMGRRGTPGAVPAPGGRLLVSRRSPCLDAIFISREAFVRPSGAPARDVRVCVFPRWETGRERVRELWACGDHDTFLLRGANKYGPEMPPSPPSLTALHCPCLVASDAAAGKKRLNVPPIRMLLHVLTCRSKEGCSEEDREGRYCGHFSHLRLFSLRKRNRGRPH
ncbi:uncharacterized protein Tco025E_05088 [Trypanosoma conorhini]|uniref:Uncharacterized protein n=1 Tax=Trypanosoma conorhini TaxID=83891 RepID=A0A422PGX0_9TRYP|nr:uncharacterized protein Tco025E_05088 [Trypanosoma conorhini]RNF16933.1 hypothetical protein Tco025E_05088 [Trypanosoma conorhini]